MHKILISLPDQLMSRMKAAIPDRQRSKLIATLLEAEILKREKALYECALAVENDSMLKANMALWEATVSDGVDEEMQVQSSKEK